MCLFVSNKYNNDLTFQEIPRSDIYALLCFQITIEQCKSVINSAPHPCIILYVGIEEFCIASSCTRSLW